MGRRKKITSIEEFMEQAELLTKKLNKDYYSVKTDNTCSLLQGKSYKTIFTVYIDGYGLQDGLTPEEALRKMRIASGIDTTKPVSLTLKTE